MKNKLKVLGLSSILFLGVACSNSKYVLSGISRQRILIDSTYDVNQDTAALHFLAPYTHVVDSLMNPVIGYSAKYMANHRPESEISDLFSDILLWGSSSFNEHPDFAVYNMGGIRGAFPKGPITKGDVLNAAPFENKICFLTLKGSDVLDLFRQMASRGGEGVSKGVNLVISKDGKLLDAKVHGQPVDPNASYRVATLDYVAQGNDDMVAFQKGTDVLSPQETKNDVRFIIESYFEQQKAKGTPVNPQIEGRIVVK